MHRRRFLDSRPAETRNYLILKIWKEDLSLGKILRKEYLTKS